MPRRLIIDVPPEWIRKQLDSRGRVKLVERAKPLTATVAEQCIERQAQRQERRAEPQQD